MFHHLLRGELNELKAGRVIQRGDGDDKTIGFGGLEGLLPLGERGGTKIFVAMGGHLNLKIPLHTIFLGNDVRRGFDNLYLGVSSLGEILDERFLGVLIGLKLYWFHVHLVFVNVF
mgnify:CR=1 FL=1